MKDKCMKNSQKNEIESMLRLMDQANDAIKKAVETDNKEIALSLLEQCQDSAIQIGGMIEVALGEGSATVGFLEAYCEKIYEIYELIRNRQSFNVNRAYKNLRKDLIKIGNSVRNDICTKIIAVFMPYKASMWDSLESVWRAAVNDPRCEAYVVPIPYFDKNPDGTLGEMHYEGSEYPNYVPITFWKEYNIAEEHPDMIFLHNPYDEFNRVTSVPEEYFSKELKKNTDKLIYIPYFILGDVNPNDREAVERIEHFCAVPAVVYADRVIVQSEEWRQIYIDVMTRTMGNDTRKVWEKKILGLGSPKIDRVCTTSRKDLDIPKTWLQIIEKPDGNWKRIIFYNTSVSTLLQYSEKMLNKLLYVLSVFRGNRDEVALLWRPHPLIKATIESMRPQLWEAYERIVAEYQEEGWGIYDDTPDINRAIAMSDAYYGDPSSVVRMYRETEKPIMLQDIEISNEVQEDLSETAIRFYSCVSYEDKLWFVSNRKEFMSMNITTGEAAYVDWKYQGQEEKLAVTAKMCTCCNCIYWVDNYQKYVHEYNVKNSEYCRFPLPDISGYDLSQDNLSGVFLYQEMLWLFLRDMPYIFEFNLIKKEWQVHSEIYREFIEEKRKTPKLFWRQSVQVDDVIYMLQSGDTLGCFSFRTCQYDCAEIPDSISEAINIAWKNGIFYILTSKGDVYMWDDKNGIVEKIYTGIDQEKSFSAIVVLESHLFLIPCQTEKIWIIDLENPNNVKQAECPDDLKYSDCMYGKYGSMSEDSQYVWLDNRGSNYIVRVNKVSGTVEWVKPKLPSVQEEWLYHRKRDERFVLEEKTGRLERFLQIDRQDEQGMKEMQNVGALIWDSIAGEI